MKKFNKILSLALVLVMVLSLVPAITFGTVAEETWTEVDTLDELKTELAKGGNIKITATELDFAGTTDYYSMPVADGTVLDANNCVFTGVSVSDNKGLFALNNCTTTGFTVKNLTVGSEDIPAKGVDAIMVGRISDAAPVVASWENVTVYASLTPAAGDHNGVYAAYLGGTWTFTDCDVYTDNGAGTTGPAGAYFGRCTVTATFTNCTANGTVTSTTHRAGGFIGCRNNGGGVITFENCTNNATVTSGSSTAGGFVGEDRGEDEANKLTLLNCTNNAAVSGATGSTAEFAYNWGGGSKGVVEGSNLTPYTGSTLPQFVGYKTVNVISQAEVDTAAELETALLAGGMIKMVGDIDMAGYKNLTVTAGTTLDGQGYKLTNVNLTGNDGLFDIGNNFVTFKNIVVENAVGGNAVMVPFNMSAKPTVTWNNVDVTATLTGMTAEAGVFAGRLGGTWTFVDCDVTVTCTTATPKNTGAYIGRFAGSADFTNCTAEGTISMAQANVGGFLGVNDGAGLVNFKNCKNSVDISYTSQGANGHAVAGFIGQTRSTKAVTLISCTNEGTIGHGQGVTSGCLFAQFVVGQSKVETVYYNGLTGNGEATLENFVFHKADYKVVVDWAELQTAGTYYIGTVYPEIKGNIAVADGVTIDGLGNTIHATANIEPLFNIAAGSTVTIKNLNVGSAEEPMVINKGMVLLSEAAFNTTWENVHVHAKMNGGNANVGAFFGNNTLGTHVLKNCSSTVYGTKGNQSGAFAGRVKAGTMTFINCVANGTVTNTGEATVRGGFVGKVDGTVNFIDCVNNTNVTDTYVGTFNVDGVENHYTTPQLKAVQETAAADGVQKIRFLAAMGANGIVDEATAKASPINFGFVVTAVVNGDEKFADRNFTLNNLYSAVTATEDGETVSVTAGDLGCAYLAALVLTGVPAEGTVVFTITPWMTYAEGAEALEGTTYTVTYTDGAFVSATPEGVTNPEL